MPNPAACAGSAFGGEPARRPGQRGDEYTCAQHDVENVGLDIGRPHRRSALPAGL